jgi:hypothetical protein
MIKKELTHQELTLFIAALSVVLFVGVIALQGSGNNVNTAGTATYDRFQNERYQEAYSDLDVKDSSYRSLQQMPRVYASPESFATQYASFRNQTNTSNESGSGATDCVELTWNILQQEGSNLYITHPGCVTMSENFNIGPANALYVEGTTKLYCKDTLLLGTGNFGFFVSGTAEVHNCHVKDKITGFFMTENAKVFDSSARFSDFGFRMGSNTYGSGLIAAKNEVGIQLQGSTSAGAPKVVNSIARQNTEVGFLLADHAKLLNSQAYNNERGIELSGASDASEGIIVDGVASVKNVFGTYVSGTPQIEILASGFCANTMDYLEQTDLSPFSGQVTGDFLADSFEISPFANSQPVISDC